MQRKNIFSILQKGCRFGAVLLLIMVLMFVPAKPANACMLCAFLVEAMDPILWQDSEDQFIQKVNDEFIRVEKFLILEMWQPVILPMMMWAAEQFNAVALQQTLAIGMFLDAKHQMETQQLMQVLTVRAHKDYHPSEGMCEFGSVMKGLAASEMRSELSSFVFSQREMDRQLGNTTTSGMYGLELDKEFRISQFKARFCHHRDRDNALYEICREDMPLTATEPEPSEIDRINRDIDFFRSMDFPLTVRVNFTNQKILDKESTPELHNEEEEDLFALSSNLFGHELFARSPAKTLEYIPNGSMSRMQQAYMDMRSIVAKRSVAINSFNAIAGSKSEGTPETDAQGNYMVDGNDVPRPMRSRPYMVNIVKNLGVNATDAVKLIGENPSYNAQMEVLTKKIFQSPDFYTNLYDKPANVKRKAVTLQAIKMMQKFDILKSSLRGEASFSVLLEIAIMDLQREIEDQIRVADVSGARAGP